MADPRLRQLTIKTGVVKRLAKEKIVCEKEILVEKKRLESKKETCDEHVVRKQEEVLQEYMSSLPDAVRRLRTEYEVLDKFLQDEVELKDTKEYENALQVLSDAKAVLDDQT